MSEISTRINRASKGQGTYGLFYASQVQKIKDRLGDLEGIRKNLSMSRRQICQILLVNPSAWTRWTKSPQGAPPHFYRALEWLIYIHSKKTNHQQNSPFLSSSSSPTPLKGLDEPYSESEDTRLQDVSLQDVSLQDVSSQDVSSQDVSLQDTESTSQSAYNKTQNNLTYSLRSLDFIEGTNKQSHQGSDQMKLLKKQLSHLRWFVVLLSGGVVFLLIRLFTRGLI